MTDGIIVIPDGIIVILTLLGIISDEDAL